MRTRNRKDSLFEQILQRFAPGDVFSAVDCMELAGRATLDQALARMARSGVLRRVSTGLYMVPKLSSYSKRPLSPNPELVVRALSRKSSCRIVPCGAMLANRLNLSEQVPSSYEYLTDGRSREIRVGSVTIKLRRVGKRLMEMSGSIEGEVYIALRYLGRKQVDVQAARSRLAARLSPQEKLKLNLWADRSPAWVRPIISDLPV